MIDPLTISAVVGGAKALKGAFDMAKEAMEEFRACAEAGMDASQSMGSLIKVFTAHGEVQREINAAKQAKIVPPPPNEDGTLPPEEERKSATVLALEAMQYERELLRQEEELKHYLIYQCNESGLYQELCARRDAIVNQRKAEEAARLKAETEKVLARKRREAEERRKREQMWELMETTFTVLLGVGLSIAVVWAIFWMISLKGKY